MSTFNAFFLRANEKATLEAVRQGFDQMEVGRFCDFIGVRLPRPVSKLPEPMLIRLSEMFNTDVIWLSFESAMDCFEFHHWQSAQHVRSLVYGLEEEWTWERADGRPEIWEPRVFFDSRNMECALGDAEDDEQRETIQRIYREAKIEPGQTEPSISAKETADAIAQLYGFPFFGFS